MTPVRRLLSAGLLVTALLGLPAGAGAQTFPSDDAGRPAPWCSYIDASVTPNLSVPCSTLHPLPISTGAASIGTDTLGYGRAFFFSASGSSGGAGTQIRTVLFTDEINVVGWGLNGTSLAVAHSADGGRTWGPLTTIIPGASNSPQHSGVTVGTSPRYVLALQGQVTGPRVLTSPSPSGGFVASTFGTGLNTVSPTPATVAIQGATVMLWTEGVSPTAQAVACRSQDNGQTFQNCVTVDSNANSSPTGALAGTITSPAANTWLAVARGGRVFRSTNDGAAWTLVLTLTSGSPAAIKCLSATVCLIVDVVGADLIPRRSTDGGATWTAQAAIAGTVTSASQAFCLYGQNVVDVVLGSNFPGTASATTTPAYRSIDGGQTWIGATATGGQSLFPSGPNTGQSDCTATTTGRSAFVALSNPQSGLYFGPTTANTVQILGANGFPLAVDSSGNFTGNQGLPQATSPNAWGVVPVQGPSLRNSQQTSAAVTANTIAVAVVAGQRTHLRRIDASCNTAAATAPTLTVNDGGTQIWALAATETVLAATRTVVQWQPSLDTSTGGNLIVTLGACTAGTSLLQVQADQF